MIQFLCTLPILAGLFTACPNAPEKLTGYVEGEYASLAPSQTARIREISVSRGEFVEENHPLVQLEDADARHNLAIAQARLQAAKATALGAALELGRVRELAGQNIATPASFDSAQAALEVAKAQEAEAAASLAQAQWQLSERSLKANATGKIDDILRQPGDMAGPNQPVISFLATHAIKLKLYAPQTMLAQLHPSDLLNISCDGCPPDLQARISYIAKEPEFTPPVIYSLDRRQKLVYLIEARPLDIDHSLQPGMIVDAASPKP